MFYFIFISIKIREYKKNNTNIKFHDSTETYLNIIYFKYSIKNLRLTVEWTAVVGQT